MSVLATNAITDASGGNTATINGQTPTESNMAGRNLFINGAMQVAQRGTSATGQTGVDGYPCIDRFRIQAGSSGTFTFSQSTTAPDGFANSLKVDCTTAGSSPNYFLIIQRMEGQNLQHLKKGTSAAESTTLSFYVRSNKTGTFQVNLKDEDNTRVIGATYNINSANTWEQKKITFAGDTTGTLGNDNGNSLQVEWWLASGSTYNSGAVPTSWEATSNADRAAGLNVAIGASTDDEFYITGVQLEAGSVATPFERRLYGQELALCHRYYWDAGLSGTGTPPYLWATALGTDLAYYRCNVYFPVAMRTSPTVTVTAITSGTFQAGMPSVDSASTTNVVANCDLNQTSGVYTYVTSLKAAAEL